VVRQKPTSAPFSTARPASRHPGWARRAGSLDIAESCTYQHHQQYDAAYREAHPDGYVFPVTAKCNAGHDLVPSWVNPTMAAFFLVFVAGVAGVVWTWMAGSRATRSRTS